MSLVYAQSRIVCEQESKESAPVTTIWPTRYLAENGQLCFDVKSWPGYSGNNCVANDGRITWTGTVIVSVDGESQGRDATNFQVSRPILNADSIEYKIEWTRGATWKLMQDVKINRLSGQAVSYLVTMHGGESYRCNLEHRKL